MTNREIPLGIQGLLEEFCQELLGIEQRIESCNLKIQHMFSKGPNCRKIAKVPGVGPITASAMVATIGDAQAFKKGRELSAFLGLVPKQYSSGGKSVLGRISKRGDGYLRKLLVHGARSVLIRVENHQDRQSQWIRKLKENRGHNRACVALANKNARIVWKLLSTTEDYRRAAQPKKGH